MQRHEHGADQVAHGKRCYRPTEGQPEHVYRETSGNDGQQHQVRTEPHGEKVARGPCRSSLGMG